MDHGAGCARPHHAAPATEPRKRGAAAPQPVDETGHVVSEIDVSHTDHRASNDFAIPKIGKLYCAVSSVPEHLNTAVQAKGRTVFEWNIGDKTGEGR